MADTITKKQRSRTMSMIKSKWTSQEKKIHNYLKSSKIYHKMHPKIKGSPDILLTETKTAVFLHGCFWHKCQKCFREPKSNRKYWVPKLKRNAERDRKNEKILKSANHKVIVIWEHQIKNQFGNVLKRLNNGARQYKQIKVH